MENFFNYISKPMAKEDIDVWFSVNNIIPEKGELFFDFCYSLFNLMTLTYFGDDNQCSETKVIMTETDKIKHFEWCWKTTIEAFKKEAISFSESGDHYDYFLSFFLEVYYNQDNIKVKESIPTFLKELFDRDIAFTKSDLQLYTEIYKLLDKNLTHA